jgi:2,4-diketo-3-deoxy-L-fuconate hydrolase
MRIANHDGRLVLVSAAAESAGAGLDVETASGGKFSADPQAIYENWDQFRDWAADVSADASVVIDRALLGPPVPRPRQVFAIGLNYHEHAAESKMTGAAVPPTFTKFPTCLTGPYATVQLPDGHVDWEVELVAGLGSHRRTHCRPGPVRAGQPAHSSGTAVQLGEELPWFRADGPGRRDA